MEDNKEKFKNFVIKQFSEYDEFRESSPEGYADIIVEEAEKTFFNTDIIQGYAEFCVKCDRENLPLICLDDYIKLKN